jgi:diamine N-acetyltransferase
LTVSLREVTADNVRAICELELGPGQRKYVAPAAYSVAEFHYEPTGWMRAIYDGEELVGLVLLSLDPEARDYWLWRLLIAAPRQGKGYGRDAMRLVIDHVKTQPGATELLTSYVPGEGDPSGFYRTLGFEETGMVEHREKVLRLRL